MRNFLMISVMLAVIMTGIAAQADVSVFNGDIANLTTGGWGSGVAVPTTDKTFTGNYSIKISSEGLHEGGRIDFRKPIDITAGGKITDQYLQISIWFTSVLITNPNIITSPGFNVTTVPGLLSPQMAAYFYQDFEIPVRPRINVVRVVIFSADGKSLEATTAVPYNSEDGWFTVAVPLKALGIKEGETFDMNRIVLCTDAPEICYLGQLAVIKDDAPIIAHAGDEQEVAVNDTVLFRAEAEGGAASLRYSWNFGDSPTAGEDATGEIVTHRFTNGNNEKPFKVTLTVSDVWGLKKPVTAVTYVSVND